VLQHYYCVGYNVRYVGTVGNSVGMDRETKSRVVTLDFGCDIAFREEWCQMEVKRGDGVDGVDGVVSRDIRITDLDLMEVLDIWCYRVKWKVIHALIEVSMKRPFDAFGSNMVLLPIVYFSRY
jgi:hypothetical protein